MNTKRLLLAILAGFIWIEGTDMLIHGQWLQAEYEATKEPWRTLGTLTFDRAAASYNGDHVIHFHHPTWRADRNDPATATRKDERKVRR